MVTAAQQELSHRSSEVSFSPPPASLRSDLPCKSFSNIKTRHTYETLTSHYDKFTTKKHVESVLKSRVFNSLCARLLNVSNQVTAVLLLLQTSEHHLGAGDVLLGVGQVDIKGVLVPGDALVNVSLGVAEASSSSSLSSPDTM